MESHSPTLALSGELTGTGILPSVLLGQGAQLVSRCARLLPFHDLCAVPGLDEDCVRGAVGLAFVNLLSKYLSNVLALL